MKRFERIPASMKQNRAPFGHAGGREVGMYLLDDGTLSCSVIDYGCALQSLAVPDRSGRPVDVVLGYDSAEAYASMPGRMGATIGRFANRIRGGRLPIGGRTFQLSINRPPNHIHGGFEGFDRKIWEVVEADDVHVTMRHVSEDGDEGYPGRLEAFVTYELRDGSLAIRQRAESDRDTVCSLTNHSYFNLSGKGTIDGHSVAVDASEFLPTDEEGIPTGEAAPAEGRMDLRRPARISEAYDTCFLLDREGRCATCFSEDTGIRMDVSTDMPAMQLYTGDGLRDAAGKGRAIGRRSGVCFETQLPPDSPNNSFSESCILREGEEYRHSTTFSFGLLRRRRCPSRLHATKLLELLSVSDLAGGDPLADDGSH